MVWLTKRFDLASLFLVDRIDKSVTNNYIESYQLDWPRKLLDHVGSDRTKTDTTRFYSFNTNRFIFADPYYRKPAFFVEEIMKIALLVTLVFHHPLRIEISVYIIQKWTQTLCKRIENDILMNDLDLGQIMFVQLKYGIWVPTNIRKGLKFFNKVFRFH